MAYFKRFRIKKDTYPQSVWKRVKDLMMNYETVEVVAVEPTQQYAGFELHAWDGLRRDESNSEDANEDQDY